MAVKTWSNIECSFHTQNKRNNNGDSHYFVLPNRVRRYCPINGPGHKDITKTSVCYLDPDSVIRNAILDCWRHREYRGKIHIDKVVGDFVIFKVDTYTLHENVHRSTTGFCFIKPTDGYVTFDFINDRGAISHTHFGHAVYGIDKFDQEAFNTELGGW